MLPFMVQGIPIFSWNLWYFPYFYSTHGCGCSLVTPQWDLLTSSYSVWFSAKIRTIMYTSVNSTFPDIKWGFPSFQFKNLWMGEAQHDWSIVDRVVRPEHNRLASVQEELLPCCWHLSLKRCNQLLSPSLTYHIIFFQGNQETKTFFILEVNGCIEPS